MSNTYYKYKKTQTDKDWNSTHERTIEMELSLTAYVGGSPNCLQLTVRAIQESSRGIGYITLTEQEQDDLIAGILERRGSISATDSEQSKIHPAN